MKVSSLIQQFSSRTLINLLLVIVLTIGTACSSIPDHSPPSLTEALKTVVKGEKLREVAPPTLIQQLSQTLDQYAPQVTIVSPENERIYSGTAVDVELKVQNLPIFKNEELALGPHLELFVDNQFSRSVYSTDEKITIDNLSPGTHTIRVFAARPWHESYKNDGAYAQTTFHVIGKTGANTPDPNLPLLTYNQPQGKYGAEPILLDFYLTNAPLHLVAKADDSDPIADWRIKVTINGESFFLDNWTPIYLQGFQPGPNYIQLEFIDDKGEKIDNVFNTTIAVIDYEPGYEDTLSKLTKGELSAIAARSLVEVKPESIPDAEIPQPVEETQAPEEVKETTPLTLPEIEAAPETETGPEIEAAPEAESSPEMELEEPFTPPLTPPEAQQESITPEPTLEAPEPIILEEIPDLVLPEEIQVKTVPLLEPIPDLILPEDTKVETPAPEVLPEEVRVETPAPETVIDKITEPEKTESMPSPSDVEPRVMDKLRSLFNG
ncbi:MAG: hypothetical protein N5P05_000051 [Chroococcopsis gigantea SAG 12.99]|jgi:hypothetical protein|nr:hypothetical protein [Chlorogloea purpurea SAG 13.99]MDV2998445.1 hypothetical protein [Chroococcopsis gigantea SAG 12.99]